jgi:hypothetical protein
MCVICTMYFFVLLHVGLVIFSSLFSVIMVVEMNFSSFFACILNGTNFRLPIYCLGFNFWGIISYPVILSIHWNLQYQCWVYVSFYLTMISDFLS